MTTWTILIATLGRREALLRRLLDSLMPQVAAAGGAVTVEALWNNGERPLGDVRQQLADGARARYVNFVDDDDEVPPYYVEKVLPLLDGVDYIGWRMQLFEDGRECKPTYHSLRYPEWYDDNDGYYRDISHLNPVRRKMLTGTSFCGECHEDSKWADQMRGRLRTEHFIPEVMYYYRYDHSESVQHRGARGYGTYVRPELDYPHFSWRAA